MNFAVIFLWLSLSNTCALTGYNCGQNTPNISTFSLLEVSDCEHRDDEPGVTDVNIQLLQKIEYIPTYVRACRIKAKVDVKHCDWRHYASTTNTFVTYEMISREVCETMHESKSLVYEKQKIDNLVPNITNFLSIWVTGILEPDGDCYGATYKTRTDTYTGVVVSAELEINFWDATIPANRDEEKIAMPSGTRCRVPDNKCIDAENNYIFWNSTSKPMCDFEQFAILFEGRGIRIGNNTDKNPDIYFANSTQEIQFGLEKTKVMSLCGYTIYHTEHSKLFITEYAPKQGPPARNAIEPQDIIVTAYFNTKIANLARHMKSQFMSLYKDIMKHRCRLEKGIIENALLHIHNKPDIVAMKVMKKQGYMAIKAGEVAHIIECEPILCKIRHITECYQELPVICNNGSYFLKPQSHIITPTGTPVDCNSILPVMFKIEDFWHQLTPQISTAQEPRKLKPLDAPTWKFTELKGWIDSGIYKPKDLEKLREHILFPAERPALLEEVARKLSDRSTSSMSKSRFSRLLDIETIEQIAASKLKKLWDGFTQFGIYAAGVMGIITIFHFIKLVVDTIIRGYTLRAVFGWGLHLIGALWGSVTHLLIILAYAQQQQQQQNPLAYELREISTQPSRDRQTPKTSMTREQRDLNLPY